MKFIQSVFPLLISVLLFSCSSTERFTTEEKETAINYSSGKVRLLIDEAENVKEILAGGECYLFKEEQKLRLINPGEKLKFTSAQNGVTLTNGDEFYTANYFLIAPVKPDEIIVCNEMKLRGRIKIISNSNSVMLINSLDLESYLKGVIPREMPLGTGNENYEALKAFAICARTYTIQQLGSKKYFDLFIDVRDQVYGGVDVEQGISNSAVDETKNLILTYDGQPAKVFYSSTCAGKTEDVKNVFGIFNAPYLSTIEDGSRPYCSISHSFDWQEVYTPELFLQRINNNSDQYLLESQDYKLEDVKVISRFESGRVNELVVEMVSTTGEKKVVTLKGNNIRSIIRTADDSRILRSILFDVELDENKNVTITGKGYGHGVGLCQYGAIGQSRAGKNYKEILTHYFPGTGIFYIDDKN